MMYKLKVPVPAEDYVVPLGVLLSSERATIFLLTRPSSMVQVALEAAALLAKLGLAPSGRSADYCL